jgi:Uma2 family endonuclease
VAASGVGYTRDDLDHFPDDGLRRELIDGELFVSPHGRLRHQQVIARLVVQLWAYAEQHGAQLVPEPNVDFSAITHLEPDLALALPHHVDRLGYMGFERAPDLVVEVSSPSTRRYDLLRKRAVYEREGVAEYWFVDLEHDQIQVYRLDRGVYDEPLVVGRGEKLTSPTLLGLALDVDEALGPPEG